LLRGKVMSLAKRSAGDGDPEPLHRGAWSYYAGVAATPACGIRQTRVVGSAETGTRLRI